jgi:hypothetical protein
MVQVVDSAGVISAAAARALGLVGKVRYVSASPEKNYTRAEQEADAGFPVALVCEDGAEDALGGANAGNARAIEVRPLLKALDWPAGRPVYLACDFQPTPEQFADCWAAIQAFAQMLDRPTAAYADWPLLAYCEARGLAFAWASGASSFNTGPAPRLAVQQLAQQVDVGGTLCDLNDVLASDWGQVPAPVTSDPNPQQESEPMIFITNSSVQEGELGNYVLFEASGHVHACATPDDAVQWKARCASEMTLSGVDIASLVAGT